MTQIATAIDISQWGGDVTREQFARAKAAGVSRVIVALNAPLQLAVDNIQDAKAVGLEVEAYIYYYFAQDVVARTVSALEAITDLGVQRIWVDAEDETHRLNQAQLEEKIRQAIRQVSLYGYSVGIYTGGWWWNKHMPTSKAFAHLPLWDARWDHDPDLDDPRYGGWSQAYMSQWKNDVSFEGIHCDLNTYRIEQSFPSPIVEIEINRDGSLLPLPAGKWSHYDMQANRDIYTKPLPMGAFGEVTIVVAVERFKR